MLCSSQLMIGWRMCLRIHAGLVCGLWCQFHLFDGWTKLPSPKFCYLHNVLFTGVFEYNIVWILAFDCFVFSAYKNLFSTIGTESTIMYSTFAHGNLSKKIIFYYHLYLVFTSATCYYTKIEWTSINVLLNYIWWMMCWLSYGCTILWFRNIMHWFHL